MVGTTTMSYLRAKKRTLKDGTVRSYWCRVEGYREDGKVHQRVIEYLGTNPKVRTIPLDPALAARVALVLLDGKPSASVVWDKLKDLGLDLPGRPKQVSFTYTPPLRRYTLRCE